MEKFFAGTRFKIDRKDGHREANVAVIPSNTQPLAVHDGKLKTRICGA